MNNEAGHPRLHEPPPGWPPEVFEAVTDALAAALVASVRRMAAAQAPDHDDTTADETAGAGGDAER